jgi:ankyrin repeat protein
VDVVRYLVEAGVSPDLAEDDGYTALHGAAEGQNLSSPIRDGWV